MNDLPAQARLPPPMGAAAADAGGAVRGAGGSGGGGRRGVGVRVAGVDLSYGGAQRVLKGIDLEILPGEFFAFLGPSGCGKTSLLRLIAGFNHAGRGQVLLDGQDITRLPPWKRDVGMVFQSYALWPHMTVRRNVAFGLEERRLPRAEVAARVEEALALVGLTDLADRRPSQLSGGQQQRVAVARTVAVRPKVLLLDEPLSNLDAKLRVQVRRELRDLQRMLGITTIFVTHDQEEANTTCDRIAVMHDGTIQQVGTPMELYARPANLFVAGFLGTANILDGALDGHDAYVLPGGTRLPPPVPTASAGGGGAARGKLVFRPQDATICPAAGPAAGPATPDTIVLPGRITHREFLGAAVRYGVQIEGSEIAVDASFRTGDILHHPGAPVSVIVPTHSVLWLAT